MSGFTIAIITGVISGIVVSSLLWVLHKLITNTLTPWIEQRLYKGVMLSGVWNASVDMNYKEATGEYHHHRNLTLNLTQKGNQLEGTFYAKSSNQKIGTQDKKEYSNQYVISGYIRDNYAILNYSPLSRNRTGLGSLVLQICHGGTKLIGAISYVGEADVETISSIPKVEFGRST